MDEEANDECFRVKNFKQHETNCKSAMHSFAKCFVYRKVKQAIAENKENQLRRINENLKTHDMSLKDLPHWHADNMFVHGELYVPPLELAMKASSYSAFRYILENTVETKVRLLSAAPGFRNNTTLGARPKSSFSIVRSIETSLTCLREKAEELEMDEIIDILDNFEEDKEIKALERENSGFNFNYEDEAATKMVKKTVTITNFKSLQNSNSNQLYLKSIMKKPAYENNDKSLFKLQNMLTNDAKKKKSNSSIQKIEVAASESVSKSTGSPKESKMCSIL